MAFGFGPVEKTVGQVYRRELTRSERSKSLPNGLSAGRAWSPEPRAICLSLTMDDDLHDLFGASPATNVRDDEAEEAAAGIAIGHVLARLRDAPARARVLRWAMERFGSGLDTASNVAAAQETKPSAPKAAADPTLSVDDLTDLFDPSERLGDFPAPDKK